ncbi:sensor histidine kinase [Noviherbaspirillum sp.]|uniref:sensor histidine kinase n=1 Tax=Noviherbaspirillum sp. TaxID=1926288 RepID=UPI002FE0B5EE
MRISRFITANMEKILAEWESFAKTQLPAATGMSDLALRDHAKQMLETIALDIETEQTPRQQYQKSKGLDLDASDDATAAATHGTLRENSGFSLPQLLAEFRALRATVLRLWLAHISHFTEATSTDMLRFNEAIDQSLAESAVTYADRNARTRDTFLAILGHDLRTPLAAMTMAGDLLTKPETNIEKTRKIGALITTSAAAMTSMVHDLLEYSRTQLGESMPIVRRRVDLQDVCRAALHDVSAAHPECSFQFEMSGDLVGFFDSVRLQQVLTNLLGNAAQYRGKEHPVMIFAEGKRDEIAIQVQNHGPVIPAESLQAIFDPLVQLAAEENTDGRPRTSLGLGLFIAREITVAHNGSISAESSEGMGTVFTVRLPRTAEDNRTQA